MFFSTPKTSTTSLENNKTKAEVMLCELLVHHNLPFTAADTFTKAVKRINIVTRMKSQVFTVSTDGSNDDKSKQFPIVVGTFDTSTGFMNSTVLSNAICEGSATG